MNLQQVFLWSKKIHRWLLWFVTILGSLMMLSGYLMHKELEGESQVSIEVMLFMRFWHNRLSSYFLIVLSLMILTGLLMWGVPKLIQRQNSKQS